MEWDDSKVPSFLNTQEKRVRKARQLAEESHQKKSKGGSGPRIQGFFSRTVIVKFKDNTETVIQFRPEPLNLKPFQQAQAVLGTMVPEVKLLDSGELKSADIWPYQLARIPGQTWHEAGIGTERKPRSKIKAIESLGRLLSKGRYVDGNTETVIENQIRPHLQLIANSKDEKISQFSGTAENFLTRLDSLKALPLFISHFDLNAMNIMVDEKDEVSGLIDWELSTPLPFGLCFNRIHTLAGEYSERKFVILPDFEEAEKGFWNEIRKGVDDEVRALIDSQTVTVQLAVQIGTLLDTFESANGVLGPYSEVQYNALKQLLRYQLPFLPRNGPYEPKQGGR